MTQWRLFTISPIGRAVKEPDLFLQKDEYQRLSQIIEQLREDGALRTDLSESGYLGPHYERTRSVRDHYYFCQAGISVAGIMVNGDILACPNIDRRFKQGNIQTDSFVETLPGQLVSPLGLG